MKKCVAIIVTVCLVLQCAVQLGIIGLYQFNKTYIAKNLCENKASPQLKCNGKCHLKKQLKKASKEQDKERSGSREEVAGATIFVLPAQWQQLILPTSGKMIHASCYTAPHGVSLAADIFHPPQQA